MEVSGRGGSLLVPGWGLGTPQAGSAARTGSLLQALPCGSRSLGRADPTSRVEGALLHPSLKSLPCLHHQDARTRLLFCVLFSLGHVSCDCQVLFTFVSHSGLGGSQVLLPSDQPTCQTPGLHAHILPMEPGARASLAGVPCCGKLRCQLLSRVTELPPAISPQFVLKHEALAHLREVALFPNTLNPHEAESLALVGAMIDQVMALHPKARWLHVGCDEVGAFATLLPSPAAVPRLRFEVTFPHLVASSLKQKNSPRTKA